MCSSENENPTSANPCIVVFEFCADACLLPRQYFIVSTLVKFVNLTGMGLHRTIWLELTLMPVNQQQRPNRLLHLKILKHRHHRKGQFPNWMEIKKQPEMFQRTSYSINGGRTCPEEDQLPCWQGLLICTQPGTSAIKRHSLLFYLWFVVSVPLCFLWLTGPLKDEHTKYQRHLLLERTLGRLAQIAITSLIPFIG